MAEEEEQKDYSTNTDEKGHPSSVEESESQQFLRSTS